MGAEISQESVFETLVSQILMDVYPARSRLPAERDLAKQLGASRPTLREALRRLAAWNLVEAKRGSGITVLESREWTIEVLPAFLRYRAGTIPPARLLELVRGLLKLRRSLSCELAAQVAPKLRPGDLAESRRALHDAWAMRDNASEFVRQDLRVFRSVVETAGLLPAVWMLNRVSGIYEEVASFLSGALAPPGDYLAENEAFFDALEAKDADRATRIIDDYLKRHDERLMAVLRGEE